MQQGACSPNWRSDAFPRALCETLDLHRVLCLVSNVSRYASQHGCPQTRAHATQPSGRDKTADERQHVSESRRKQADLEACLFCCESLHRIFLKIKASFFSELVRTNYPKDTKTSYIYLLSWNRSTENTKLYIFHYKLKLNATFTVWKCLKILFIIIIWMFICRFSLISLYICCFQNSSLCLVSFHAASDVWSGDVWSHSPPSLTPAHLYRMKMRRRPS